MSMAGMLVAAWSADALAAVATWATFGVAVLAAVFARHQVLEARKTREAMAEPFVVVDLERSDASSIHMNIVVENIGSTIAKDVTFKFSPPLQSALHSRAPSPYVLSDAAIFKRGITSMPPGKRYVALFEEGPALIESDLPRSYEVEVTYKDIRNLTHTYSYTLDFNLYFGLRNIGINGVHQGVAALEGIKTLMTHWTVSNRGMRVYTNEEVSRAEELAKKYPEGIPTEAEMRRLLSNEPDEVELAGE